MSRTGTVKLVALGVALVAGVAAPYLFRPFTIGVITLALIFGLYAMSIDLMGGYGGLVTLGHAGIFATGAYGVAYVAARLGGGYTQQLLTALVAGLIVSAVFAAMAMRVSEVYFLMVTLAQGMIVWGYTTRSIALGAENGLTGIRRPPMVASYWQYYYLCLAVVALAGAIMWVIVRSPFGLSLRGLKASSTRLQMLGYNPALTKFYIFMLAGFFGTISGVLFAYYNQFVSPSTATFLTSGRGVLMAILGGISTLVGPLIGAFIIVFIENVLSIYIARWPTLLGLVFILTIMFAPQGILGALSRFWHRRFGGGGPEARRAENPLEADGPAQRPQTPLTERSG